MVEKTTVLSIVVAIFFFWIVYLVTTDRQNTLVRHELERRISDLEEKLHLDATKYDVHKPSNRKRHQEDVERRKKEARQGGGVVARKNQLSLLPGVAIEDLDRETLLELSLELSRQNDQLREDSQAFLSGLSAFLSAEARGETNLLQLSNGEVEAEGANGESKKKDGLLNALENLKNKLQRPLNTGDHQAPGANEIQVGPLIPSPVAQGAPPSQGAPQEIIATLLLTYNRPEYLARTLDSVFNILPERFPLFVSQDGDDANVARLLKQHPRAGDFTTFQHHPRAPPASPMSNPSYWYISQHYGWAIGKIFKEFSYSAVIIIEDDLLFAPDFYDYFLATLPILRQDPKLWCISAWNDIGNEGLVSNPKALRRTDFFPGLGWLMTRELWEELGPKWPGAYWDDWMREPPQRKGRQCIQPEVSRSGTFGASGSSGGQFFNLLKANKLNQIPVDFAKEDLSYLLEKNWDDYFFNQLFTGLTEISKAADLAQIQNKKVVYRYHTRSEYERFIASLPRKLQIISDEKAGIPRSSYKGIVFYQADSNILFIAPR